MLKDFRSNLFTRILFFFICCASTVSSTENIDQSKAEITRLLQKWPQDFNAKNLQGVCGIFASNLIASYQGAADRHYEEMCRHFTTVFNQSEATFHYEAPKIEQILISDNADMAVVRLIWTLKISYKNRSGVSVIKEKGIDVFKRQEDGSWKIFISYAYPEPLLFR